MHKTWTRFAPALFAALLGGCAMGPWPAPGMAPPLPGTIGPGPDCGPQPYPFQALHNFVRGHVVIRTQVGADGRVADAQVEQPAFDRYLTQAALQAVGYCRIPGAPAGATVRLVVVYELYGQSEYLPNGYVNILFVPPGR